ncbi:MAG: NUDIX domain-containing protein [Chloroflexi bacterium]|nr:NUDIX domain-containing protein [Chloroflexota bacterium]
MRKHFTATAFVVRGDKTLLHWHRRLGQWMPPGGHIEPDEEPAEAALREVREETGLVCEVVATSPTHAFAQPRQLPAPYTVLLENIPDSREPAHMHIDLIYFVRPVAGANHDTVDDPSLTWVTEAELRDNVTLDPDLPDTPAATVAEDVRTLALAAIAAVRSRSA